MFYQLELAVSRSRVPPESLVCDSGFFDLLRKEAHNKPQYEGISIFGTIPVKISNNLPPNTAAFVDKDGNILATFTSDT